MTTIASNRRCMAGDTKVSNGSTAYYTPKVFEIGDSIVGVAGNANLTTKFLAWFRKECPADEVGMSLDEEHEFVALVLNARGLYVYNDCTEPDRLTNDYFAIGSGADAAIAYMSTGKTPAEAVRAVIKHPMLDSGTGGDVIEKSLPQAKKPTRRKKPAPTPGATPKPPSEQDADTKTE